MNRQKLGLVLFGAGLLYAFAFAGIATWDLIYTLRTHTAEELKQTIWAMGEPLFFLWAFSVPLGAVLASIGAFILSSTKKIFIWLTGVGVLAVVFIGAFFLGRFYFPPFFGIGGIFILVFYFSIVWLWVKKYEVLNSQERIAASFQLIGYLFLMIATWFLCGETAPLRLLAFAERSPPNPVEIMVYLIMGWLFLFVSHYQSVQLKN